jgi:hypothetical protein
MIILDSRAPVETRTAVIKEPKQIISDIDAFLPFRRSDIPSENLKEIIRSSLFLKEKYNAKGEFEKIKARLVADGSKQIILYQPSRRNC